MKKNNITMTKFTRYIVSVVLFLFLSAMVFADSAIIGTKTLSLGPRATFVTPKDADQGQWFAGAQ